MAWLFGDGFDFYDPHQSIILPGSPWLSGHQIGTLTAAQTRFGAGLSFGLGNFEYYYTYPFANSPTIYLNFACRINPVFGDYPEIGNGSLGWIFTFRDGSTNQCAFCLCKDGSVTLTKADVNNTFIANTKSAPFPTAVRQVWNHYQVKVVIDNVNGSLEVRLNGELTPSWLVTGVNTRNGSSNSFCNQMVMGVGGNVFAGSVIDDLYCFNNLAPDPQDFQGDVRAIALMPNSDLSVTWTPSTGTNNFSLLGLISDGDTKYISTNVPGNTDTYSITPFPSPPLDIVGIQTKMLAREDDAGPHSARLHMVSGLVTSSGATTNLPSTYIWQVDPYMVDPNTGVKWTQAGVEAIQLGPVDVS